MDIEKAGEEGSKHRDRGVSCSGARTWGDIGGFSVGERQYVSKHHRGFSAEDEGVRQALAAWPLVEAVGIACEDDWLGSFLPVGKFSKTKSSHRY